MDERTIYESRQMTYDEMLTTNISPQHMPEVNKRLKRAQKLVYNVLDITRLAFLPVLIVLVYRFVSPQNSYLLWATFVTLCMLMQTSITFSIEFGHKALTRRLLKIKDWLTL